MELTTLLTVGTISGIVGASAMNGFMRLVSAKFSSRVNMTIALGSLITGRMENASLIGTIAHGISGIVFGNLYVWVLSLAGMIALPGVILSSLGIAFIHGLTVSYGLMFFIGERHPIEAFRAVTIQVGLLHLIGHLAFGLSVALVVAFGLPLFS